MENRRRKSVAPLLGAVAIVLAVVVYLLLTLQPKDVDMPGDDASPEQVVAAYMEALDGGDCDTAEALVTPQAVNSAAWWCNNVARMGEAHTGAHQVEAPRLSNHTAPDEVVTVAVSFDLGWRLLHKDPSMDAGHTNWSYGLVRSSPEDPWRIFAEGQG